MTGKTKAELLAEIEELKQKLTDLENRQGTAPFSDMITDIVPAGVTIVDKSGQVIYANRRAEQLLGLEKDSITQRTYNEPDWKIMAFDGSSFPDEDLPFSRVMATGKPVFDVRHAIEHQNGRRVLLSINGVPVFDHDGQIQQVILSLEDVTRQVEAMNAVQASQEHWHAVVSSLPNVIMQIDPDGLITYINRTWTGNSPQHLLGTNALSFVSREERPKIQARFQTIFDTGQPGQFETRMFSDTLGSEVDMLIYAGPLKKDEQIVGATLTIVDITERKQMEESLRRSQEQYAELFNTMLDGYAFHEIITDERDSPVDYRFLDINPAWERATGLKRKDVINKTVKEVLPDIEPHWIEMYGKVALTGQPVRFEQYAASVGNKWFEVIAFSPKPRHFSVVFQDVTERKKAQEELRRHKDELEKLVEDRTASLQEAYEQVSKLARVRDEFVSNVSHELRTPLTSLKLQHHLMGLRPEEHDKYLKKMGREINRLTQLVEDLLRLSRLDQKRVDFNLREVDLNMLVQHYVIDRDLMAAEFNVTLSQRLQPDLPTVLADEGLIGQVVSIFLTNAFNYTPENGEVTVATHYRDEDGRPGWAGISVSDTGMGIDSEDMPRLFERFYRGKAGVQSGKPGTGLGLALAKEIVALHHGTIDVHSEGLDRGAAFYVWLPVDEEKKSLD